MKTWYVCHTCSVYNWTPVCVLRHEYLCSFSKCNMVDCGNSRCLQEKRSFKKELLSWSKKIPIAIGKYYCTYFHFIPFFIALLRLNFNPSSIRIHCQNFRLALPYMSFHPSCLNLFLLSVNNKNQHCCRASIWHRICQLT